MHKPFASLKVALVADEATRLALEHECRVAHVTPWHYRYVFKHWKPDLLLVESAWQGRWNSWKYGIAAYPDHAGRSNRRLRAMVSTAKELGIPCIFWSKEDGVHFERFSASASLFDAIFTVDENSVPRYRELVRANVPVNVLMFAVQPAIHHRNGVEAGTDGRGCFLGSYSRHIHPRRRERQEMLFQAANKTGLVVYDRNSNRLSRIYRYPKIQGLEVRRRVRHKKTAATYAAHRFALNVNTVDDSPTMFSRRLIEIMASGGLAVTTPALSVSKNFGDLCHVVDTVEEAQFLFDRLHQGWTLQDREMVRGACDHVHQHHTWAHRLQQIADAARCCHTPLLPVA
jgi:spore maturation protein CgeB